MKLEDVVVGKTAYTIRFSSVFPKKYSILAGVVKTKPKKETVDQIESVRFQDSNGFSGYLARIDELFATEAEAREYFISWLEKALNTELEKQKIVPIFK